MCDLRKVAGLIVILTSTALLTLAQSSEQQVVKVDVALVSINVVVTNPKGRHVPGLTEMDFHVTDRGTQVPLEFFERQGPAGIVFVVDTSSSMKGERWKKLSKSLRKVLLSCHSDYRYSLISFANRAQVVALDVTGEELWMSFSQLKLDGDTALYDGLLLGLETVRACTQRQKALVLLSDGADNKSVATLEDVASAAYTVKTAIYTVGLLLRTSDGKVITSERDGQDILLELAWATGALASFPKEFMTTEVLKSILTDIGSQYTLSYYAPDDQTGWRDVRVAVASDPRLRLRYQSRYRRE